MVMVPFWLMLAHHFTAHGLFHRNAFPVSMDSSTAVWPLTTTPSTGIRLRLHKDEIAHFHFLNGITCSFPDTITVAVLGPTP